MTGSVRHGWAVFAAMAFLFLVGVVVCDVAEQRGNPIHQKAGVAALPTDGGTGGNMEGKEVRFGIGDSTLFATVTTDASCGADQLLARLVHADRRPGAARQHRVGRDHRRRRRRRPLRDVPVHRPLGLHRGAHGRPHARVPRQEDRGARGQARDALGPRPDALHPGLQRRGRRSCRRACPRSPTRARTGSRRSSTPSTSGAGNNGSAFAGSQRQHALLQHDARASTCSSAASSC